MSGPIVCVLVVASAVGAAAAGTHPTGTAVLDEAYAAAVAALVTAAGARARRWTLLLLAAVAVIMSRGWLLIPGGAAMALAFGVTWPRRPPRWLGALVAGLAIQVVLRWPDRGFQGLTVLVAVACTVPLLVSAYRHTTPQTRRWARWAAAATVAVVVVGVAPFAAAVWRARATVSAGVQATDQALTTVNGGGASHAVGDLQRAHADFTSAAHNTAGWWTAGAWLVPVVAQQRRAIADATGAGRDLTAVAAQQAAHLDTTNLGYHQGHVNLAQIAALSEPLTILDRQLTSAQARLAAADSKWLAAPIQSRLTRLGGQLDRAKADADLAEEAVKVVPGLLGSDGPRHYFIAFMTPSESRGLDGLIGSYGEVTVDHGVLTLTHSGSTGALDGFPGATLRGPADYLARYSQFRPQDFFKDATYSPDFPTVADVISQLYPQVGGDHLDGVLTIDPVALAAILNFTGPISLPGLSEPLDSANASSFLLREQYVLFGGESAMRHDFLESVVQATFAKLVSGTVPGPQTVARELAPVIDQGRLLFWSNHADEQPLLRRLHLDGSFPTVGSGDLLAVTTQNAGNNKIDAYLHRSIDDRVRFDPATGHVNSVVTVTLRNDAPSSGLSPEILASPASPSLPDGTNDTWISVYSPLRLQAATSNGVPLPMESGLELGVGVFSSYLDIPPGGEVTLELTLVGAVRIGSTFSFALRNQPMDNAQQVTVEVRPTNGWVAATQGVGEQFVAGSDEIQSHTWTFQHSAGPRSSH